MLFSTNLSESEVILSIGVFVLVIAVYFYVSVNNIVNLHGEGIEKLHEKVNIYKDIAYLKSMMETKMDKRGQFIPVDFLIRIIQIGAIVFAVYIILKALGVSF